jgi:hypothetical protein
VLIYEEGRVNHEPQRGILLSMSLTKKSINVRSICGATIMGQWHAYFKQMAENEPGFHTGKLAE